MSKLCVYNNKLLSFGNSLVCVPNKFKPLEHTPAFWLDASRLSEIMLNENDRVIQWSDLSGNNKHALPAAGMPDALPILENLAGKNSLKFDKATYDRLEIPNFIPPSNTPFTIFTIFQAPAITGDRIIVWWGGGASNVTSCIWYLGVQKSNNSFYFIINNPGSSGPSIYSPVNSFVPNQRYILTLTRDLNNLITMYIDGVAIGSTTSNRGGSLSFKLGWRPTYTSDFPFHGNLFEVLYLNKYLDSDTLTLAHQALTEKWKE